MDPHPNWAGPPQNPNPNNPNPAPLQNPNYPSYYPNNFNSDPYNPSILLPPGVDPPPENAAAPAYSQQQQQPSTASFYLDPNAADAAWAAALSQYNPAHYAPVVSAPNPPIQAQRPNPPIQAQRPNPPIQAQRNGIWKIGPKRARTKKAAKKPKIVRTVSCEVCKLFCDTQEVFDIHMQGKKHWKNLDKLINATTPAVAADSATVPIDKPIIGPEPNPEKSKARKARKKAATVSKEDLETKRRKIMEEGASADDIRACAVCNVVCNTETVFNYHLAGQKHAALLKKLKKHNANGGVPAPTPTPSPSY